MKKNHFQIVRETKIVATDSLLTLHAGEQVEISCTEFACMGTVNSAVCRLNQRSGWREFEVSTNDNGATLLIKRNTPDDYKGAI